MKRKFHNHKNMNAYISSPVRTDSIIRKYKIGLKKSLGQNFLVDTNIAKKIVSKAKISSEDIILEIGSGIGSLTEVLLPFSNKIICIEIDRLIAKAFKDIFTERLGKEIELIEGDALKLDYCKLSKEYKINKIVSNLPYKIAAPLLIKILIEATGIDRLFVTIQRDIADRVLASPGDKNYSLYTVKSNFLASYNVCFQISRNCFRPKPFVDSTFIEIIRKDSSALSKELIGIQGEIENKNKAVIDFFKFIDDCFSNRRKKIINSLISSSKKYLDKKVLIIKLLNEINKDENVRAEELKLEDFIFLYKNIIN